MAKFWRDVQRFQAGALSRRTVSHRLLGGVLQSSSGRLFLGFAVPRGWLLRFDNVMVCCHILNNRFKNHIILVNF